MVQKSLSLFLALLCSVSNAQIIDARTTEVKSTLSEEVTAQLIEEHLPQHLKTLVPLPSSFSVSNQWSYPNCFWFASTWHNPELAQEDFLKPHSATEMMEFIKDKFVEVQEEQLQAGDLVLFYIDVRFKAVADPDHRETLWHQMDDVLFHAAVYLEDGVILQKKNNTSRSYVLNLIEEQMKAIRDNYTGFDPSRGYLKNNTPRVRYFRKR